MNKDLKLNSIQVKGGWYYEEPRGVSVVVPCGKEDCHKTTIVIISWAKIIGSVKRKQAKEKR